MRDNSGSGFDPKKIKKIEFSDTIKHEKSEKSIPFSYSTVDRLVFDNKAPANEEVKIGLGLESVDLSEGPPKAKDVNGTTIFSEQSFENPVDVSKDAVQISLRSSIDDKFS